MSPLRRLTIALPAIIFLLCNLSTGQLGQTTGATVQVRVVKGDDRPVEDQLRVELLTSSGLAITSGFTDSNGTTSCSGVRGGAYRLRVTGMDVAETVSGTFFIDPRERNHTETVVVQPRTAQAASAGPASSVAVVDLNVPKPAQKAYDKGLEAFNRGKLDDARQHLEKAISEHPNYASAYNVLGLTFMRQGEVERGQQAFEKAVALNDRFADAYTNLAKVYFRQQKIDRSEALLEKSLASEPRSPEALTILAQVELMLGKYEQSAANARRVHDFPHKEYAIAHFVAARAFRARNQREEAVAEYKLFLQEAPNSTSAPQAREELTQLEIQKP